MRKVELKNANLFPLYYKDNNRGPTAISQYLLCALGGLSQ